MKLKAEKVTYYSVEYGDLEKLVQEVYPEKYSDYCFVSTQECGNDSSHTFNIDGKLGEVWEKWDKKRFEEGNAHNYLILNKLCADKYIKPGKYIIDVCW